MKCALALWVTALACGYLSLLPAAAGAHPLAPALLELRELEPGRVEVSLKTSRLRPAGTQLEVLLPDGCVPDGPITLPKSGWVAWKAVSKQAT